MNHQGLGGARVILTGASSGIGWALAHELVKHGARVVLAARSAERLQVLAEELQAKGGDARPIPTDVANAEQRAHLVNETVRAFGGIDILINNAGVGASGFFREVSEARLREIFEINFFGATELTRVALPHLLSGRQPMLVNVSSVIGRRGVPGHNEYCASKFALCGWSEALRAELKPQGVHVLLVCPGLIATPFREHQVEDRLQTKRRRGGMSPERCAQLIVKAVQRRANEATLTAGGTALVLMNRFFPRVVDWFAARYAAKLART